MKWSVKPYIRYFQNPKNLDLSKFFELLHMVSRKLLYMKSYVATEVNFGHRCSDKILKLKRGKI